MKNFGKKIFTDIKKKYIYLFLLIIFIILLFNFNQISLKPNSNTIKVENRTYYNKSFGLNYLDNCQNKFLMTFNRKIPNFNSNIIITLVLIYPDPFFIIKSKIINYIDILSKEIDFNFSLAIITYNNDISQLLINNHSETQLKYISKFSLSNIEIPNSEYFSFVSQSRNKIIDVFYTNTKKSKYTNFTIDFLKNFHYTSIRRYRFRGYYAAGTNYYAYILSHLGIFDFFDFFVKFDHDLIKRLKKKPTFQPFPLKKMIMNNKYFFFGCKLTNDAHFVSTNLYKTFFLYILRQKEKCNYAKLPLNLYKYGETISSPGAVNIGWLGFYSMLNIRYFSEQYISSPYGLYINRWGDQQFFIPTLFGFNFSRFSYFTKNTNLCSWL